MIRAICFDMDGVLVDSERMSLRLVGESAALQGCIMTPEQCEMSIGANDARFRKILNDLFPGRIDVDRFMQDWLDLTMEYVRREGVPLMPQARETLAMLRRRGMKLALCTSNVPEVVREYLALAGLTDFFDAIITGDMVTRSKPDPSIYLLGAQSLGVPPEECAGVEDSVSGVRAVHAAGMKCVMVPDVQPYTVALAAFVDHRIDHLGQLEEVLFSE